MTLTLDPDRGFLRAAALVLAVAVCVLFATLALSRFVIAVASDPQIEVGQEMIEAAAAYFPDSARLQARLAARLIETGAAQTEAHEAIADRAVHSASRAVRLAPWHYENWLLLAAAQELKGNLAAAEAALDESLKRAPHNVNVRWRLANLLVREDKLDRAMDEFRTLITVDQSRLPATLSLVWQASGERLDALISVSGESPGARLALARFLIRQGRLEAATAVFKGVDRQSLRELAEESGRLIDDLLAAGRIEAAADLWCDTIGRKSADDQEAMSNGGFETPVRQGLEQFDWHLDGSEYARIGTSSQARTGARSLKIVYLGRETTKLNDEVRQLIVASPGARYRLECYARAENLVTPDGPQIVVTTPDSRTPVASTSPVATSTRDWQSLSIDFIAPATARALIVSIRQTPQFSYVEPTKGTVWFDDFSLKRQ
jgi:tetratricopeptide (TPR) repeat protein